MVVHLKLVVVEFVKTKEPVMEFIEMVLEFESSKFTAIMPVKIDFIINSTSIWDQVSAKFMVVIHMVSLTFIILMLEAEGIIETQTVRVEVPIKVIAELVAHLIY